MDASEIYSDCPSDILQEATAEYLAHEDSKLVKGRPTKYLPEMCETVIRLGEQGLTIEEIAVELGVSRKNFYEWIDRFPTFRDSVKEASFKSLAWYNKTTREAMDKPAGATSPILRIWYGKNVHQEHWRDRSEVKQITDGANPLLAWATELAKQLVKEKRKQPKAIDVQSVKVDTKTD